MFHFRVVMVALCGLVIAASRRADEALRREAASLFGRIAAPAVSPPTRQVALGQALFWDVAISSDGKTACVRSSIPGVPPVTKVRCGGAWSSRSSTW